MASFYKPFKRLAIEVRMSNGMSELDSLLYRPTKPKFRGSEPICMHGCDGRLYSKIVKCPETVVIMFCLAENRATDRSFIWVTSVCQSGSLQSSKLPYLTHLMIWWTWIPRCERLGTIIRNAPQYSSLVSYEWNQENSVGSSLMVGEKRCLVSIL